MTHYPDRSVIDQRLEARTRATFGQARLNPLQQRRHLQRLGLIVDGEQSVETKRGNMYRWVELASGGIALVAVALVLTFVFRGSGDSTTITDSSAATATSTQASVANSGDRTAATSGCQLTSTDVIGPPDESIAQLSDHWYAGQGLWAGLALNQQGIWYTGPNQVTWWHADDATIDVSGQRLDGKGDDLIVESLPSLGSSTSILTFPSEGCWEITATAGSSTLSIVVKVQSHETNPAHQTEAEAHERLERERAERIPFPVPASCVVNDWDGPTFRIRREGAAAYYLDGDGLIMGSTYGVLSVGDNVITWLAASGLSDDDARLGPRELTLRSTEDAGQILTVPIQVIERIPERTIAKSDIEGAWISAIELPADGCWELEAQLGSHTLMKTVYIYPR